MSVKSDETITFREAEEAFVEAVCEQMGECEFSDRDSLVAALSDVCSEQAHLFPQGARDTSTKEWIAYRINYWAEQQGYAPLESFELRY